MRWAAVFVVLAACGRLGFDPVGDDASGSATSDASATRDASATDVPVGGAGEACASAGVLVLGQQLTGQSLASATNDVMANLCPDGIDLVYALTASTSGTRTISLNADFTGAVVTSPLCPPSGANCSSFVANTPLNAPTSIPAGTTYVIVEKSSGAGTTFSLRVQ